MYWSCSDHHRPVIPVSTLQHLLRLCTVAAFLLFFFQRFMKLNPQSRFPCQASPIIAASCYIIELVSWAGRGQLLNIDPHWLDVEPWISRSGAGVGLIWCIREAYTEKEAVFFISAALTTAVNPSAAGCSDKPVSKTCAVTPTETRD